MVQVTPQGVDVIKSLICRNFRNSNIPAAIETAHVLCEMTESDGAGHTRKGGDKHNPPRKSKRTSCPALLMGFRTVRVFGFCLDSQTTGVDPGVTRCLRCSLSRKLRMAFPKETEGPNTRVRTVLPTESSSGTGSERVQ